MRKFAPVGGLEALLALLVEEVAGEEVVAAAILHVALALEIILANGALSGVGLLNLGRPIALVLVLGVSLRGLVGLGRGLNELQRQSAGISALATVSSFATCATTSNCASKVVGGGR